MNLVTGATGLLGSHIVEKLRAAARPVRVLVRPGSDTRWLKSQGVEFAQGDVTQPESLRSACAGCDVVYHSAAKVGDWGPWEDYQRITIDGTRNVVEAAVASGVRRLLHISSVSVYGYHTGEYTVDESFEPGFKVYPWAYYTRSKIEAERLALEAHRQGRIETAVIRPAWIYGERDRTTIARLVKMLRARRAKILGPGDNRLNVVYSGNIADACLMAADAPRAAGEIYNISNDGEITQKDYFALLARTLGAPPVTRHVPYRVAYTAGFACECWGRLTRSKTPPFITRYAVWLMGRRTFFTTDKARAELGWRPQITYDVGVPRTVAWYLKHTNSEAPAGQVQRVPA